jgi:hypothetical protein
MEGLIELRMVDARCGFKHGAPQFHSLTLVATSVSEWILRLTAEI